MTVALEDASDVRNFASVHRWEQAALVYVEILQQRDALLDVALLTFHVIKF